MGLLLALFWSPCISLLRLEDPLADVGFLLSAVILFVFSVPLIDCILWRLRLDEHGVTQTVFGWQINWAWKDFNSGAIEMDGKRCFVRTDWPWWRPGRKLRLSLDPEDRHEVLNLIAQHSQRSPIVEAIERQLRPWQTPPKSYSLARILFATLTAYIALAMQLSIALAVSCTWILIELAFDVELLRRLDEQSVKLVIVVVWCIVCFITTDSIKSILGRVGLLKYEGKPCE